MDGPRAIEPPEDEEIVDLINGLFREGTGQDVRTDYPLVYEPAMLKNRRIVKVDGKIVAHVPVLPREVVGGGDRFTVGMISATLTHPDYRHRGYATRCLRDCVRTMEEDGWPLSVLWTQEATFPFYQNSGWEAVASQGWVYRVGPADAELFAQGPFDVVPLDATNRDALDAVIRIHDAQSDRFARTAGQHEALFTLPKTGTFLAMRGSAIAAYVTLGWSLNKPGMIEAAGELEGVEALVRHVLERHAGDEPVQAVVPLTPTVMAHLLEAKKPGTRRPIEEALGIGQQMHRINSLEGLLRAIENHLRRTSAGLRGEVSLVCQDTSETVTLSFDDGSVGFSADKVPTAVVLTRRELTQLIFGPHPSARPVEVHGVAAQLLGKVFPYTFAIPELDHC